MIRCLLLIHSNTKSKKKIKNNFHSFNLKKKLNKKGIYSLITTFLFIMVVLFVVMSMIYIGNLLKAKKGHINDELIKYNYMMDAKNRILSAECHGQIISETPDIGGRLAANETCEFPINIIKGYKIEMLVYDNCTDEKKVWEHRFSDEDGQEYPYFIPIQANGSGMICPGRLKGIY